MPKEKKPFLETFRKQKVGTVCIFQAITDDGQIIGEVYRMFQRNHHVIQMDITLDGKRITFDQATGNDYYVERAFASLCTQVGIPTEERETDSMELRGAIEYIFTKHLGKKVQVNRII